MSAIVQQEVNVSEVVVKPRRMVRKLTEKEIADGLILTRHKRAFEDSIEAIRLVPFQKDPQFLNDGWEVIMSWLCEQCDYRHSKYYGYHYEDFVFTKEDDDFYIQTPTLTDIYRMYSESEMNKQCDDYIAENILSFSVNTLWDNLKQGAVKYELIVKTTRPDNAPHYESVGCPVCFCDFVDIKEEDDFIYKKAVGVIPKEDDRVVRIDTCCGHMICRDCFNSIRNIGNQSCPTCRGDLDCWDEDDSDDDMVETEYTKEDIDELLYEGRDIDEQELLRIIDLVGLREYATRFDGYEDLLGGEGTYEFAGQYICQI